MPHRLKVLEQKTPTVKEIIEQLAKTITVQSEVEAVPLD